MNDTERELLDWMLSKQFPGNSELRRQLSLVSEVDVVDSDGSIRFLLEAGPTAHVKGRIPVEAEVVSADNVVTHALLHVVDGRMFELEFYREDGLEVSDRPEVSRWSVDTL